MFDLDLSFHSLNSCFLLKMLNMQEGEPSRFFVKYNKE
jgi:hypothetical protein